MVGEADRHFFIGKFLPLLMLLDDDADQLCPNQRYEGTPEKRDTDTDKWPRLYVNFFNMSVNNVNFLNIQ